MKPFAIVILTAMLLSFTSDNQISDEMKFAMYKVAINDFSTAPYYVVVNVQNARTGELKSVCSEAPFVHGAIDRENCPDKSAYKNRLMNKDRHFEFNCTKALENIGFDEYSSKELDNLESELNFDSLAQSVRQGVLTSITFTQGRKYQTMYAHLMFDRGVMMRRGCIAGNICSLEPYEK